MLMKFFSRVIAGVLTAAVMFALVPADVTRADSPRVEITIDTAFVRDVFSYPYDSLYVAGRYDNPAGQFSTDDVDSAISVVANGTSLSSREFEYLINTSDIEQRCIYIMYSVDDLSLYEAGSSVDVTINDTPMVFYASNTNTNGYALCGPACITVMFSNDYDNGIIMIIDTSVFDTIDMYRLYNPNSGEHFYTSSAFERQNLIDLGWNDEGTGWYAPSISNTPVYRLYNPNAGEHHYTTNAGERDVLVAAGWNYEGVGWYSYEGFGWYEDTDRKYPMVRYTEDGFAAEVLMSAGWIDCGGGWYAGDVTEAPLYREYNPNEFANNHNYTTNRAEHEFLVSIGWYDEGTGWYGVG